MFTAWWFPFSRFGVIHGDPHLGNYTCSRRRRAGGINLLDYGCIRIFPPKFVGGVVDLYNGLLHDDRDLVVHAYETWGFTGLCRARRSTSSTSGPSSSTARCSTTASAPSRTA
jgi:predicted unusual protein kinase regulating ubiquinone biosynthesis (AarF/ABC1/UbiB family)